MQIPVMIVEIMSRIVSAPRFLTKLRKYPKWKKHKNVFNPEVSDFISTELLEMVIGESFNNTLIKLDQKDPYYEAKKNLEDKKKQITRWNSINGII